jgi:leader peptidase (prepilin peptidase)/N-methyltransferase
MEILALLCLITAIGLLILLAVIDFKTFLLPNIYVAPFALTGVAFHFFTDFYYLSPLQMIIGGGAGYGILYLIRAGGNKYYGQDSLGLGDVKLLGASGLWLGLDGVLFAMTIGAMAGLIHGIIFAIYKKVKTKQPFSIARLTIPAGPGFVIGILLVGAWMYQGFVIQFVYDFFI